MRYADGPTADATVHVAAAPERVWALVSDIHLVAALSTEVQEVGWLDGAPAAGEPPAVGARFRGRNHHRAIGEWTVTCHVVECDPPRVFSWAVEDPDTPAARWWFTLTPRGGGTDLRQWARMGPGASGLSPAIAARPDREERIIAGRLAEWQAGIESNLAALKESAERAD